MLGDSGAEKKTQYVELRPWSYSKIKLFSLKSVIKCDFKMCSLRTADIILINIFY